jgi:predicted O-linked N-acetylglucosamine transferase (SPINDLY family)
MWAAIIIERIGIRRIKKDKEGKIRIRDCFAPKVGTVLTENCPQVMTGKGGLVMALLIVLITAYATRTIIRNRDWRTHASVWRATVKVSPLSPKAHNNMGDVYSLEGNEEKAAAEFRRAIELKPDYADAYHNLALTYQRMGRLDEAVVNYEKAVLYNPRLWQSYQNLAVIYAQRGEAKKAREYWEKAQEVKEEKEK